MMEEDPSTDIKRRRISAADGSPQRIRCLTDLPSGILAQAASFLAAPSRALFAVALEDENSAASPNERSAAIVGNQWDILDFEEIEEDLAVKLSDAHIEKVLTCIDAINNLRRLKMANCVNITGAGLEPLRGSTIIEQIDLSILNDPQHYYDLMPRPAISCDRVLPVLDSIIEREGCALMHLQFPCVCRERGSTASEFHAFMLRYNQMWRSRGVEVSCLECNTRLPTGGNQWIETRTWDNCYGLQRLNCYDCFKHYCYDCVVGREGERMISSCETCKRGYCTNCSNMRRCRCCGDSTCNDCYENRCHKCNEKICLTCVETIDDCYKCEACQRVFCSECSDPGVEDFERTCVECHDTRCNDCRFRRFQLGQNDCAKCMKTIGPLLADECKRLCQEVEQLKVEIKELRSKS